MNRKTYNLCPMNLKKSSSRFKVERLFAVLALVLFSHCGRVYHSPINQQATLFREAGEGRLQAAFGSISEDGMAADVQGAMALTDRWAVQMGAQLAWGADGGRPDLYSARGGQLSAGLGYYKPLGRFWVVENYTGLGMSYQRHFFAFGWFNDNDDILRVYGSGPYATPHTSRFDYTGAFVYTQPAIGFRWKCLEAAVSTNVHLGNTALTNTRHVIAREEASGSGIENNLVFLAEPAFTLRLGLPQVKLQAQFVLVHPLNNVALSMPSARISFGVMVPFTHQRRWQKQP